MMSSASDQGVSTFHSPISIATMQGRLEFVKYLIERGANPLDKDMSGRTAVHFAAMCGRLGILKYLVEDQGCNPMVVGMSAMSYTLLFKVGKLKW